MFPIFTPPHFSQIFPLPLYLPQLPNPSLLIPTDVWSNAGILKQGRLPPTLHITIKLIKVMGVISLCPHYPYLRSAICWWGRWACPLRCGDATWRGAATDVYAQLIPLSTGPTYLCKIINTQITVTSGVECVIHYRRVCPKNQCNSVFSSSMMDTCD